MKLRLEGAIGEADDDEMRRRLEVADHEVDRLSDIVDRLLLMAREIEEGAVSSVDVGDAVTRAIARWNDRAAERRSSLASRGEPGSARVDATDLDQILDNLLDNATTYAPGEVTVETGRSNGRIYVAVQDHGEGIDPRDLPRVTERFYRGREVASGGSGLGLAIARQLAEKWGGSLNVESARGRGTRIELRLDAAP